MNAHHHTGLVVASLFWEIILTLAVLLIGGWLQRLNSKPRLPPAGPIFEHKAGPIMTFLRGVAGALGNTLLFIYAVLIVGGMLVGCYLVVVEGRGPSGEVHHPVDPVEP